MTTLKQELIEYIQDIPDEKLIILKPLISMLAHDVLYVEKITESDLSDEELASVMTGYKQYQNNECVDFEEYLSSRN